MIESFKMVAQVDTAEQLRDQGNEAIKLQEYVRADELYTEALQLTNDDDKTLRPVLYRNRALARLKRDDFEGAQADCNKALEFDGADVKALFRRAQAREQLGNVGSAFQDAKEALRLAPQDKNIIEALQRLVKANNDKIKQTTSLASKVNDMEKLAFRGEAKTAEDKVKALQNLLVLCRESESGATGVWNNAAIFPFLLQLIDDQKVSPEVYLSAVRILDECLKNHARCLRFLAMHHEDPIKSVRFVCRLMCKKNEKDFVDSAGLIVQRVFNAMAKMDRQKDMKPDPEVAEANKLWIIRVLLEIQEMLQDPQVGVLARETAIDLLLKNLMHMDGGIPRGWSWKFVDDRGLLALLDVASQIPEQCDYPVSAETRQHVAICLQRLEEDMVFDTKRAIFKDRVDMFFNALMSHAVSNDETGHKFRIKLSAFLITMLQGPVDIGLNLITNDQVTALMLQMAESENNLMQGIAAELIVATVSKHERAVNMLKVGIPILRGLYESEDPTVKVRALVGLCKIGAAGGDDISRATMEEKAVLSLAKTCKKFLLETEKFSVDIRRYACEGLSYLSLDADVKEWIVDDSLLLKALLLLAQKAGPLCVYTLATIYANLSNAFEKPKVDEEMVKLAQFAKHHVPETHPKDTDEYVKARVKALMKEGAVPAMVAVSKTESTSALELIARAILAFAEYEEHRGQIIGEGGLALCLRLTREATPEGKIKAAHAIAKLGAAADPTISFAGQRAYEVVKPLCDLLHPECEGKANYDALLTLTNLASVSDSIRARILKEKSIPKIEEFWFMTDHEHLRAAAAELLLNLLFFEKFFEETVEKGTDRLKLWVLYSAEPEERLSRTSAAGFAILTEDEAACARIMDEIQSWPEVFKDIAMHEDAETQRRGLMGIANIMQSSNKLCSEIVSSEVFRVLVAITKLGSINQERAGSTEQAKRALEAAEKLGLIKATDRELYERANNMTTISE